MSFDTKRLGSSAAKGAAAGTAIMPGWGTAIGAAGGTLKGAIQGDDKYSKAARFIIDPLNLFGGGDDSGDGPPPAPPPVVAPVLDPNAGIGGGYGPTAGYGPNSQIGYGYGAPSAGETQIDQQLAPLLAQQQQQNAQWHDIEARASAARGAYQNAKAQGAPQAELDRLYAAWQGVAAEGGRAAKEGNPVSAQIATLQAQKQQMSQDPYRFSAQAAASYNRAAPQATMVAPDRSQVQQDIATQAGARNDLNGGIAGMQGLAGRLNSDLMGNAPSLAQAQLDQTTQQNLAAQRSMAASAGPMDYAAAQRAAIMSGANVQQQSIGQAAMLRAQEYAAAEGLLGQTTQNIANAQVAKRAQDLQNLGYSYHDSIARAQFEAQQNQFNTGMQAQQNSLNQGREAMYLNAYQGARSMQQQNAIAQLNAQVQTNATNRGADAANYATASQNAAAQQARSDQQNRDLMNGFSSGLAAYKSFQGPQIGGNSPSPNTAPQLGGNNDTGWGNNQYGWT